MQRDFPYNNRLLSMDYTNEVLKIVFKKRTGGTEERVYEDVPKPVGCKLFYKESAKEVLSYFSKNIKKKFKVKQINNQK